jgi:hypothetical protein
VVGFGAGADVTVAGAAPGAALEGAGSAGNAGVAEEGFAGVAGVATGALGAGVDGAVAGAALPGAAGAVALVVAGSNPGRDCGSGFIGSEAGEKPGTVEAPAAGALEALVEVAGGAAGALSAGDGAEPAGTLPGSSPPTFAPGVISRSFEAGCGRVGLTGALGFEGASSA